MAKSSLFHGHILGIPATSPPAASRLAIDGLRAARMSGLPPPGAARAAQALDTWRALGKESVCNADRFGSVEEPAARRRQDDDERQSFRADRTP